MANGEGTVAGTHATAGAPQQPQLGGAGGSSGIPPQGICAKVCVNMVTFVIDNPLPADRFFAGDLKACRNGDQQCHTGPVPAPGSGNTVLFAEAPPSDGRPTAWSPDEWKTIEFSWADTSPMALHDGDVFSLTFEKGDQRVPLLEQVVTFQVVQDCAGTCLYARYELQGATLPQGGESNLGGAGASFEEGAGGYGDGGMGSR